MKTKRDPVCGHCGKEYTERSEASYRHFDKDTGKVTWCHSKSVERRIKLQREGAESPKQTPLY